MLETIGLPIITGPSMYIFFQTDPNDATINLAIRVK